MSVSQDASVDIQVDRCGGLDACVLPLPALQQHDAQAAKYDKYSRLDWLRPLGLHITALCGSAAHGHHADATGP